jgi:predicted  nucleic acid-binding Zn-ribbon protein
MSSNHHKTCTACGSRKPVSEFHRKAENPDGYRHHCRDCIAEKGRAYREANPETVRRSKERWAANNPERVAEFSRNYYRRNKNEIKPRQRSFAGYTARTRENNPEGYARLMHKWAKRRADRARATPLWYDDTKVKAIYRQAERMRRAGFDVHVDHIIPLCGENVCGLHVHNNLRIIPAKENIAKGAKLISGLA